MNIDSEINQLKKELRRCVDLLDGECKLPDGSNADTRNAHALLGDFEKKDEPSFVLIPIEKVTPDEINKFKTDLEAMMLKYHNEHWPNNPKPVVTIEEGRKFFKVKRENSTYAFIEKATGNVFKSASHSAPAKGIRGNIRDANVMEVCCGPISVVYFR
jgi:hypothetical protein